MKFHALIPARAGSKRIPNKNIVEFHGMPLITWPLSVLMDSQTVSTTYVSSDSNQILRIAERAGAKATRRCKELSDDNSGLLDVVQAFLKNEGAHIDDNDALLCVLATNVWLTQERIDEAVNMLSGNLDNFVVGVGRFPHPPERSLTREGSLFVLVDRKQSSIRTQDISESFFDAGYLYLAKARVWRNQRMILGSNFVGLELDRFESIDIDEPADLEFARAVFPMRPDKN